MYVKASLFIVRKVACCAMLYVYVSNNASNTSQSVTTTFPISLKTSPLNFLLANIHELFSNCAGNSPQG